MKLTELETNLLNTLRENSNPDDYNSDENGCWFTLECTCESYCLDIKIYRGVLASLLKKDVVIDCFDEAPNGQKYYTYDWG